MDDEAHAESWIAVKWLGGRCCELLLSMQSVSKSCHLRACWRRVYQIEHGPPGEEHKKQFKNRMTSDAKRRANASLTCNTTIGRPRLATHCLLRYGDATAEYPEAEVAADLQVQAEVSGDNGYRPTQPKSQQTVLP